MKQGNPYLLTGNLRRTRSCRTKCTSHLLPFLLAVCALFATLRNAEAVDASYWFAVGAPITEIYDWYTPAELNAGGYSFSQIIGASPGNDFAAIQAAGATASDFYNEGVPASSVYALYTPTELHAGGAGYTYSQIIVASPGDEF